VLASSLKFSEDHYQQRGMRSCVYLLITSLFCGLAGCGDAIHEHLTGAYILIAIDTDEQLNVAYDEGNGISIDRMGPVVTDVGWNSNYIVAAVRPKDKPGSPPAFFYLEIAKDSTYGDPFKAVTGPLTKSEFERVKTNINLPEFTRHFPNLR
jgi:hypothetical protein